MFYYVIDAYFNLSIVYRRYRSLRLPLILRRLYNRQPYKFYSCFLHITFQIEQTTWTSTWTFFERQVSHLPFSLDSAFVFTSFNVLAGC